MDDQGLTWLEHAPKIKLLREDDKNEPYPLSWEEQLRLFNQLPSYLAKMALFNLDLAFEEKNLVRSDDCTVLSPLNLIGSWKERS